MQSCFSLTIGPDFSNVSKANNRWQSWTQRSRETNRTRLLILLLLPALAAHSFAGETNLVGATTARVGRSLFLKNCAQCHGDDARGDEGGPDLHGLQGSDEWIEYRIRNGVKGEMPAFREKYSQSDIDALIAYLRSLISPDRRARGDGVTEHDGYSRTTTDLTQQSTEPTRRGQARARRRSEL